MDADNSQGRKSEWSRRQFLLTTSGVVPAITGTITDQRKEALGTELSDKLDETNAKYTPVGLENYFTASAADFGTRERPRMIGEDAGRVGLVHVLGGRRSLQGIPFSLGSEEAEKKSWIVLSTQPGPLASKHVEIPLKKAAHYICFASFCEWDKNEAPLPGQDVFEQVGQHLANVVLIYDDGSTHVFPIRRRYETTSYVVQWDRQAAGCYAAVSPVKPTATRLDDPLSRGTNWGGLQTGLQLGGPGGRGLDYLWVCALKNPRAERSVQAIQLQAAGEDPWVVCGLTLFHRPDSPLQYKRLSLYRLTLPRPEAEHQERWRLETDLGVIVRTFTLPEFERQSWLSSPSAGFGEKVAPPSNTSFLYAEITSSPAATLILRDLKAGENYEFDLSQVVPGKELEARRAGSRIEILEAHKTWVHARVLDSATGRPTPVRLAFRSKQGRYIPPYGHRTEVNDAWLQGHGADLKILDSSFAYVDGTLQAELPVGEVYVEMMKGFEYEGVRQRLEIKPGQRDLTLSIPRFVDLRSKGWVTADTHTHFLSPTTALLEAQAEGLNLIHLLAAQWGAYFSNVADFSHGPLVTPDRESMVWVGTENRHHLLGHLALLGGVHESPVYPMSVDGVFESYFGDPMWTSLADWAEACRQRGGLAVSAHFPYPTGEIAADIVLGKIDALEIWPRDEVLREASPQEQFNTLRYLDWYHYLNCGYRLPAVGGTDKMGADTAAGANRVYTYIGQNEFNFPNWAAGVRKGNTFVTSGPLLFFQADGHWPGEEITLGAGGGKVEVSAEVKSFVPIHKLEVIFNGRVVASREQPGGVREITLKEKIDTSGPGWLAARCASRLPPGGGREYKVSAHTSPVYVRVPGVELFSAPAATYFLKLIDGAQTYVETLAVHPDPERLARIRKVYSDARAEIHRRLHQHGVPH